MYAHAYMPEAYHQQQTVRELQNGALPNDTRYALAPIRLKQRCTIMFNSHHYNFIIIYDQ